MPNLHSRMMAVRNYFAASGRSRQRALMSDRNESPCNVVFYHRVADNHPNDWTISRRDFVRHLDYFQEILYPIGLAELQRRIKSGQSPEPTITITFDDGYQENMDFALPLLVERQIPCTYFVSTAHVLDQIPFPHDVAAGVPLAINTASDIRRWSDAGIEMGCHTRHHVDFSKVYDKAEVKQEIQIAKDELEQMTGKQVRYFAFPFGMPKQLTQDAIEVVHQAGFDGFCSAFGAYNLVGDDAFHIRRFHGDPQFERLVNWCSYDSSKARCAPKVRYYLEPHQSFAQTRQHCSFNPSVPFSTTS